MAALRRRPMEARKELTRRRSRWRAAWSSGRCVCRMSTMSSAYELRRVPGVRHRRKMLSRARLNRRGPNKEPCGTPLGTGIHVDCASPTRTVRCRSASQSETMVMRYRGTWRVRRLSMMAVWATWSKARLQSRLRTLTAATASGSQSSVMSARRRSTASPHPEPAENSNWRSDSWLYERSRRRTWRS